MIPLLLTVTQITVIEVLLLSVAGFFGMYHRYLELTAHFKPHYLVVSLLCLFICVSLQAWVWALYSLAVFALNLAIIAPWYLPPAHASGAKSGQEIKVLCANVQYTNTNYAAFLRLIREEMPHVVIAQETNEPWLAHLRELTAQFSYAMTIPGSGGSGIALYSRLPVTHAEAVYLGQQQRPGIIARLRLGASTLSLVTIHPPLCTAARLAIGTHSSWRPQSSWRRCHRPNSSSVTSIRRPGLPTMSGWCATPTCGTPARVLGCCPPGQPTCPGRRCRSITAWSAKSSP